MNGPKVARLSSECDSTANTSSDTAAYRKQLPLGIMWDYDGAAQRVLHTGNAVDRLGTAAAGLLFLMRLPAFHLSQM